MHKYIVGEIIKNGGTIERIVPMKDLSRRYRTIDMIEAATLEAIWQLIKRHGEEAAIVKEALWKEVASALGYESLEALHDEGKSLQIEHVTGDVLVIAKAQS